jgi:hypothetical protein
MKKNESIYLQQTFTIWSTSKMIPDENSNAHKEIKGIRNYKYIDKYEIIPFI